MALTLSNSGISTGQDILAAQISQSIDALTKTEAYDITISGSLTVTGSFAVSSSNGTMLIPGLTEVNQTDVLVYNRNSGNVYYTASSNLSPAPSTSPYCNNGVNGIYPLNASHTNNGGQSTIGGGFQNTISCLTNFSSIASGCRNTIQSSACYAYIGSGLCNYNCSQYSFIGGGNTNTIQATSTISSILNGTDNCISRCSNYHSIASGCENAITGGPGTNGVIAGGKNNTIGGNSTSCNYQYIGNGQCNNITDSTHASIISGFRNSINGDYSSTLGGCGNCICHNESFIIGSNITSSAACTTYVNNLNVGCTVQLLPRNPLPSGQAGMLIMSGSGGTCKLYFHNGSSFKEVCLLP